MADAALDQFDRKPRGTMQENKGDVLKEDSKSGKSPPSQRQRRRLNRPLEDFDRNGLAEKQETTRTQVKQQSPQSPQGIGAASQSLFQRYQQVKNGATPVVRDSDPNMWEIGGDDPLPTIDDSPLSRKSVGRGTPGTAQSTKSRALEKVLSWNMSDDFNEQSMIASTPANFGKRMTLAEIKQAEMDASALRNSLLEHSSLSDGPEDENRWGNATNNNINPRTGSNSYKTQLQEVKGAEAEVGRTRYTRPASRGGENERLQDIRNLEFGDTEDEVFLTLPEIPAQGVDSTFPQREKHISPPPGRKENISLLESDMLRRSSPQPNSGIAFGLENKTTEEFLPLQQNHPSAKVDDRLNPTTTTETTGRRRRYQAPDRKTTEGTPVPGRSRNNADDSIDVLRRLSRSVSGTPTPQKTVVKDDNLDRKQATFSPPKTRSYNPQMHDESSGEASDPRRSSSGSNQAAVGSTDRSSSIVPKTPQVTGAWIETPMPSKQFKSSTEPKHGLASSSMNPTTRHPVNSTRQVLLQSPSLETTAPNLPTSALSALVGRAKGKAKRENLDDGIGDSTINSLEGLMGRLNDDDDLWDLSNFGVPSAPGIISEEDRAAMIELLEEKIANELPYSNGLPPSSQERRLIREIVEQRISRGLGGKKTEESDETATSSYRDEDGPRSPMTPRRKGRLQEELQLQRMSEHVNSMHSRTRSLSKGLGRIERKLADSASCSHKSCDGNCFAFHPVSAYSSLIGNTLYRATDDESHLTTLGWTLVVSLFWAFAELMLWYVFLDSSVYKLLTLIRRYLNSRPIYSSYSPTDYGPFKTGPSPPFLLSSAISQPLRGSLDYLASIATAFWIWLSDIIIASSGEFMSEGYNKASRVLSSTATRAVFETLTAGDPRFDMGKDEVVGRA
jgi:hypothetical protein